MIKVMWDAVKECAILVINATESFSVIAVGKLISGEGNGLAVML